MSDYGQFATVVDLREWFTALDLDREWADNEFTRFPLAFLGEGDTAKVVASTDWNRLDVFTLPGGDLLTDRETAAPDRGEKPPEHYLDYFQGALHVSPSGRWLVVDGWGWHPVGMPMVIDVEAWLGGEIHAAEKGRTITPGRYGTGDQPIAWVDDTTVAVQAHDPELDGVELYDVATGRLTGMFAGAGRADVGTPRASVRRRRSRVRDLGPGHGRPDRVRRRLPPHRARPRDRRVRRAA